MKKVLFSLMTVALLAMSCSKDVVVTPVQETMVTFEIALENAAVTRTIGNGSLCDLLVYEVYDMNDTKIEALSKTVEKAFVNGVATVKIPLAKDQTYSFAFWAQNSGCEAYDTKDLKAVKIDYTKALANDETRDAFFAYVGHSESTTAQRTVSLKRPFAQLNLAVSDLDAAKTAGIELSQVKVTTSCATVLNLTDGTATDPMEVTFGLADVYTDKTLEVEGGDAEGYNWVSMNYLLPFADINGDARTTEDVKFTLTTNKSDITITSTATPIQRNWRTNLIAKLTEENEFEVKIEAGFVQPGNDVDLEVVEKDLAKEELKALLEKGGHVVLNVNPGVSIDFDGLAIEKDLTLILNAAENPVGEIKLGGNVAPAPAAKSAAALPHITIVVSRNVAFPSFTFNKTTENYTIQGDLETNKPLDYKLVVDKANSNLKFTDIKLEGLGAFEFAAGTNVTVENCKGENLAKTFVYLSGVNGCNILNNECSFASADTKSDYGVSTYMCNGNIVIDGNKFVNPSKHGIQFNDGATQTNNSVITVNNNVITGAGEDAIKADKMSNITITNNELKAMENGIRLTRLEKDAEWTITGNIIDMSLSVNKFFGIAVGDKNQASSVAVNLTVKENKPVNIPDGCYLNISSLFTLSGDYEMPYTIADGVALSSDGKTFAVSNANGLKWVADICNSVVESDLVTGFGNMGPFELQTVKLMNNIDLSAVNWTPIANVNALFAGTFDGNGKTISGLNVIGKDAGLFNKVNGTVKDITLTDVNISAENYAGALVAYCYGKIDNCHVIGGTVASTTPTEHVGGLVGMFGEDKGLSIVNSSVKNLTVKGSFHVGGLVGAALNSGKASTISGNTIENVTVEGRQTGLNNPNYAEGIHINEVVGLNLGAAVSGNTTANNNVKLIADGIVCDLTNKVYQITNGNGLAWASTNVFAANGDKVVDIMNDIDMTGIPYTPAHYGTNTRALTINGNGKTISNLKVEGGNFAALLGRVSYTCVIKDLTIKDSYFVADNNKDGEYTAAAFIGWMASHTSGTYAKLINCKSENVTYGSSKYVGGLVGYQTAEAVEINGCSVTGMTLTSEYTENNGGEYKGHAGGVVGYLSAGTITGTSVQGAMTVKGPRAGGLVGTAQADAVIGTGNTMNVTLNGAAAPVVGSVDNRADKDNSGVTIL